MNKKIAKFLKDKPRFSVLSFLFFGLSVAIIGVYLIIRIFAATSVTHTFRINPSIGGTVKNTTSTIGYYINCPTVYCSRLYGYTTTPMTYQAYPKPGYKFIGWEASPSVRDGYDYTVNPLNITRTRDWTFTATFAAITGSDRSVATQVLQQYINACPSVLSGSTVTIGATPNGQQAITYYTSKRTVINTTHTASVAVIMAHEVYHTYDYWDPTQSTHVINWGENIPPSPKPACITAAAL